MTLLNTLKAILMSAVDTFKSISHNTTAAEGKPDSEITKDLAILKVIKCIELRFGVTIAETSDCFYFSELLVFLTIFFEEKMLAAPDVKAMEKKTSLLTGLLLKTFGLLVGVEATLRLTQVCLFEGTLTDEKPAKNKEDASVATKGSLS
ncbi:hypothetical protein G9A89_022906 [Geosiphon pyriformis]|nr:hypothetical protein G9A89_022906 [Geosiphon pyriformis]